MPPFHLTGLSLDDLEGMLDLGAHHGVDPVDLLVDGVKLAALRRFDRNAQTLPYLLKAASRLAVT